MSSGTNGGQANGTASGEPVIGYLSLVEIENIRSIASLRWEVEPRPGWNVVLGDNGSGKSTFLRAAAYALIPDFDRASLRIVLHDWVRSGAEMGYFDVEATIQTNAQSVCISSNYRIFAPSRSAAPSQTGTALLSVEKQQAPEQNAIFSAGFGPFRRFTGGDAEYEKQFAAMPNVARHLSLFDERVSLSESLSWLKSLRFKELEEKELKKIGRNTAFLHSVRGFINQPEFLPNGAHLGDITSDNVLFIDGNGAEVSIAELSDGYRSILSLILELIRQLASHYGSEHVFDPTSKKVIAPGIVLIDEVDAHLHPSWQSRIGLFLRACFPAIQFIVTTHSAFVCQAAEVGSVFQLPRPGTSDEGRMVRGVELDRLLYGDLVDAYDTEAMGGIGRSERAKEMLGRFSELNRREIDKGLSDEERKEQRRLRAIFSASPETRP
jgi:energy-coupling factor transporter ATP-binding protein EcfA2